MKNQLTIHQTLKIHLLCSNTFLETKDSADLQALNKEFPERFIYLVTKGLTKQENHVKSVSVDNHFFDIGGTGIQDNLLGHEEKSGKNFYASFLPPAFNDLDIIGAGELAKKIRVKFFDLFQRHETIESGKKCLSRLFEVGDKVKPTCPKFEEDANLIKNVRAQFLFCHPNEENEISKLIASKFRSAKKMIHIAHLGFNPPEEVRTALECRDKKVNVTLTTNSANLAATAPYAIPNRKNYPLVNNVYEMQSNELYHKKVLLIDQKWTMVGSYNFTMKSHASDDEFVLFIDSKKIARIVDQILQQDHKSALQVSTESSMASNLASYLWGSAL